MGKGRGKYIGEESYKEVQGGKRAMKTKPSD